MDETKHYINLVLTVKKYPALYDLSCNDYHNRMVRNKMWNAVAQEVNATAAECKEKWKNLRASYSRHLRNQSTANSRSKKPYYMADYMDFLLPYRKSHRQDEGFNEEGGLPQENWNDEEIASDTSSMYEKSTKSEQKILLLDKESESKIEEHGYSRNKSVKFANDGHRCPDACIFGNRQDFDESINDSDWLFLKSLLPDIREMTGQEKRNFKITMLSLIDKIFSERESVTSAENDASLPAMKSQREEKRD